MTNMLLLVRGHISISILELIHSLFYPAFPSKILPHAHTFGGLFGDSYLSIEEILNDWKVGKVRLYNPGQENWAGCGRLSGQQLFRTDDTHYFQQGGGPEMLSMARGRNREFMRIDCNALSILRTF